MGPPLGVRSVSMTNTRTCSGGTAISSATIKRMTVTSPCPISAEELRTSNVPSVIEFHFCAGYIGRAAAKSRVLVGRGKAPGAHQVRVVGINYRLEGIRVVLPHFCIHFVDAFHQTNRFSQYLSRVGDAANMQCVHPAQFDRLDVQCLGEHVHHRLDGKRGLRDAKTAERARRRIVGVHGITIGTHVRDVIRTRRVRGGTGHHLLAERRIRARVAIQLRFHRDQIVHSSSRPS